MACLTQFVYVDLSPTSLAIAKARAELAGCTNVKWIQVNKILQQEQALVAGVSSNYKNKLFYFIYYLLRTNINVTYFLFS